MRDRFAVGVFHRHQKAFPAHHLHPSLEGRVEDGHQAIGRVFGQKTQGAHVDAQDGRPPEGATGDRQQGAVAAEDDEEIDLRGKVFAVDVVVTLEDLRGLAVDHRLEPESIELGDELPAEFKGLGTRGLENNADATDGRISHRRPFYGKSPSSIRTGSLAISPTTCSRSIANHYHMLWCAVEGARRLREVISRMRISLEPKPLTCCPERIIMEWSEVV